MSAGFHSHTCVSIYPSISRKYTSWSMRQGLGCKKKQKFYTETHRCSSTVGHTRLMMQMCLYNTSTCFSFFFLNIFSPTTIFRVVLINTHVQAHKHTDFINHLHCDRIVANVLLWELECAVPQQKDA